jgi:hypothetical protein
MQKDSKAANVLGHDHRDSRELEAALLRPPAEAVARF